MNSAVLGDGLKDVLELKNLSGTGGNINDVRSKLMKIIRKENKEGYPILNVSHKTVEIIMAGLLSWDPAKADEPFEIS